MAGMVSQGIDSAVRESLSGLDGNRILLILTSPEKFHQIDVSLVKHLVGEHKKSGIIISLASPAKDIISAYTASGIDCSRLQIIDASGSGGRRESPEGYLKVTDPTSLVELSMTITAQVRTGNYSFILVDEIMTLARHNSPQTAEHFVHFLVHKIKLHGLSGIVMLAATAEKQKTEMTELRHLFDKIISI